jgi:Big-like domain-containing protein/WD40 repeat protein
MPTGPTPATVALTPDSLQLIVGAAYIITAHVHDASGLTLPTEVAWSSADASVASVDSAGRVRGLSIGTTIITATAAAVHATATIAVGPRLTLSPPLPSLFAPDTIHLSWTLSDVAGNALTGAPDLISRRPQVVTVSSAGVATGVSQGTAWVVASLGGTRESVEVFVLAPTTSARREVSWRCGPFGVERLCLQSATGVDTLSHPLPTDEWVADHAWSSDGAQVAIAYNRAPSPTGEALFVTSPGGVEHRIVDWGQAPRWCGSQIFYYSSTNGNAYVTTAAGGSGRLLAVRRGGAVEPSPDCRRIAFFRNDSLIIVRVDKSTVLSAMRPPVTPYGHAPLWSPDGRLLVFTSWEGGISPVGIWLVRSDGTGLRPVSANCVTGQCVGGEHFRTPAWSPDGRRIAYSRGSVYAGVQVHETFAETMDTAGSVTGSISAGVSYASPAGVSWSPDGARLLFVRIWIFSPTGYQLVHTAPDGNDLQVVMDDHPESVVWRP